MAEIESPGSTGEAGTGRGLLTIGAFSSFVRLSVRMLRYHDRFGVLSPAYVDPQTGYRYYSGTQVPTAVLLRTLRDLGFSVSAIAAVLPHANEPDTLRRALQAHRDELIAESSRVRRRLADLDHLVDTIQETTMTEITVTTIPERITIGLRGVIPTYADEGQLWDTFTPLAMACTLPERPTLGGATFFDQGYQESDVDLETWVSIDSPIAVEAPLTCKVVSEHRAVVATVHGDYTGISPACADLAAYLAREGLTPTGEMSNLYVVGPAQSDDVTTYVTQIEIPI